MLTMHTTTYLLMAPGTHMYLVLTANGICQMSAAAAIVFMQKLCNTTTMMTTMTTSTSTTTEATIETTMTTKLILTAKSTFNNKSNSILIQNNMNYCYFKVVGGK